MVGVNGAQVQLVSSKGGTVNLGGPGFDGLRYYYDNWINQSELGLYNAGDLSTFYLHFSIPFQPDEIT